MLQNGCRCQMGPQGCVRRGRRWGDAGGRSHLGSAPCLGASCRGSTAIAVHASVGSLKTKAHRKMQESCLARVCAPFSASSHPTTHNRPRNAPAPGGCHLATRARAHRRSWAPAARASPRCSRSCPSDAALPPAVSRRRAAGAPWRLSRRTGRSPRPCRCWRWCGFTRPCCRRTQPCATLP
jgi:hypothetical protein